MRKRNLPQPFQIDKIRFGDCFTDLSLRRFAVLITGWALTVGVHTISQAILNRVARAVVDEMRGCHSEYVFTCKGRPIKKMYGAAWRKARERADLPLARVHDLKHTFGRRLRAVGISFEDRQELLGHKSGRITTHYSQAELENLINSANKVCEQESRTGDPEKKIRLAWPH